MNDDLLRPRNLSPKSVEMLHQAGITSCADLEATGPVLAYLILKHRFPGSTLAGSKPALQRAGRNAENRHEHLLGKLQTLANCIENAKITPPLGPC